MSRKSSDAFSTEIAETGYPVVRQAFNRALAACVAKLTKRDMETAQDLLEIEDLDELATTVLMDTALFTRPGDAVVRRSRQRAVDRIAPKIQPKRDPLMAAIAERLPQGFFSVFEVESRSAGGGVVVRDLIDGGRSLTVMDAGWNESVRPGMFLAARLLDLGPWHVGFGIVFALRRSEAAAILIALSYEGEVAEKCDSLHELVYLTRLHDADLVALALEPIIAAVSLMIDESEMDIEDLVSNFRSMTAAPAEY